MSEVRIPTIHLDGTSRDELLNRLMDAGCALDAAIALIAQTAPNGRDYYPQGPSAIREATAEHESRIKRLREVYAELQDIASAIADQEGEL